MLKGSKESGNIAFRLQTARYLLTDPPLPSAGPWCQINLTERNHFLNRRPKVQIAKYRLWFSHDGHTTHQYIPTRVIHKGWQSSIDRSTYLLVFSRKDIPRPMSYRIRKTEHNGAKNGGGYWGKRHEAKMLSKRIRRQHSRRIAKSCKLDIEEDSEGRREAADDRQNK